MQFFSLGVFKLKLRKDKNWKGRVLNCWKTEKFIFSQWFLGANANTN